jgi:hypothetical protein
MTFARFAAKPLAKPLGCLARAWRRARMLYQVLLLVRFSVLLGIVCGLVLFFNDQAQDVLRVLGEDADWGRVAWFVLATLLSALVAWWSARVMFYFRFRNPASWPHVFPKLKEYLPRLLGAAALLLVAGALFKASLSYTPWISSPGGTLLVLAGLFALLAAAFVYVTTERRTWFARWIGPRPEGLGSLRELTWQAWLPLVLATALGFTLMVLLAYEAVAIAPALGTATVAMLAVVGLIPVGSLLVYLGNRARLPIVSLTLIWMAICAYVAENHYVRLFAGMDSYRLPAAAQSPPPPPQPDLEGYFDQWAAALGPKPGAGVPVFIVAAEGGGIRAAYWTAIVLGELEDRGRAAGLDFARHVFAVSGVSGGSLGAATFAALTSNQRAGAAPKPLAGCPVDEGVEPLTVRGRAERILRHDFLAPTVAVMLFPDLFQHAVPRGFLNDRAVALEQSFEAAWDACEEGGWFGRPFRALWSEASAFGVPPLFLNSTVVETGQRLIAAPVRIGEPEFSEALDSEQVIGAAVALSTSVHDSARFTYLSPDGLVRRQDAPGEWLRLVDGGYFENSGAVTAGEIVRNVQSASEKLGADAVQPIVIHISNDPETTDPADLLEQRKWLDQALAPVKALLNTRAARGFQAREDLAKRVAADIHFRLCRNPGEGRAEQRKAPLPLGWALSGLARAEMRRQLGVAPDSSDEDPIVRRNRANLERVLALLKGEPVGTAPADIWTCPQPAKTAAAS